MGIRREIRLDGIAASPLLGAGSAFGRTLALAPNGKLVLGGTDDKDPSPADERYAPAIVRFQSNGSLDTGFGAGGIVEAPLSPGAIEESLEGIAVQPDNKIIATGTAYPISAPGSPVASRYIGEPETAATPKQARSDLPPDTNMKKVPHKVEAADLTGFRGTASDPDGEGLRRVQVALVRTRPHRAGASGSPKPRHWRTARGKGTWSYILPKPVTPGRYVVFSRAQDEQGLSEGAFSRRDHNRYRFRVTAPGD